MKTKYKLLQWYPDTPSYMMAGFIIEYYYEEEKALYTYPDGMRVAFYLPPHHLECRNFWELIEEKELLFITEDGVEVFDRYQKLYAINKNTFKKGSLYACYSGINDYYVFYSELSRDNYIWRNKPVFSYEDFIKWGNAPYQRVIEQLAKERI